MGSTRGMPTRMAIAANRHATTESNGSVRLLSRQNAGLGPWSWGEDRSGEDSTSCRCRPRDARHWFLPLKSNRFDKSVGIEVVELHEDGATMCLPVRDDHLNVAGVVHGGVTFSLADSALGYGISKAVGRPCTTAEMKINFLKPVAEGVMIARSRIIRKGRRLVVARAEVHCGDTQVAMAQSTFAILD